MAKKRRRSSRNFTTARLAASKALSTLGSATLIGSNLLNASDSDYRAISVDLYWALNEGTVGEGPISVGLAHGDYSDGEIEECIEQLSSMARGDKIAQEQNNRLVRMVGVFTPNTGTDQKLNDGKLIRTRLNWHITTGKTIKIWAYNNTASTLTTGAVVAVQGVLYARWST